MTLLAAGWASLTICRTHSTVNNTLRITLGKAFT
jgi:hypothetical protein